MASAAAGSKFQAFINHPAGKHDERTLIDRLPGSRFDSVQQVQSPFEYYIRVCLKALCG
jgi:hypothetical protein